MKWMGFSVLLIVPLAFGMICLAVLLESWGILKWLSRFRDAVKSFLHVE